MKHLRVVRISFLALLSVNLLTLCGITQTKSSSGSTQSDGSYVFRSTVRRVPVDVVVQDKDGRPVLGLKQSDFIVQEDGKDQRILSFDVAGGPATAFVPPKLPPMPPNTFVDLPREPERGPLYILYYDNVGPASMKFSWSSPSTPKQIIPASRLYGTSSASALRTAIS